MAVEDKQIAMRVRREIVRRSLDASQLMIHVAHGHVELGGILKPANRNAAIDMAKELEFAKERVIRIPGVRDMTWRYLRFFGGA